MSAGTVERVPTALITGASRGLGEQIARQLAPTHSLILGGRPSTALDALAAELGATTFAVELTDHDSVAAAEVTRVLLPALRAAQGHVVFINSGAGIRANPGWGAYAASKFGLRALADALRGEETSLRVTSVFPGRIDTDMQRELVAIEGDDYDASKFLKPSTVAGAVVAAIHTPADAHPTEIVLRPTGRG